MSINRYENIIELAAFDNRPKRSRHSGQTTVFYRGINTMKVEILAPSREQDDLPVNQVNFKTRFVFVTRSQSLKFQGSRGSER